MYCPLYEVWSKSIETSSSYHIALPTDAAEINVFVRVYVWLPLVSLLQSFVVCSFVMCCFNDVREHRRNKSDYSMWEQKASNRNLSAVANSNLRRNSDSGTKWSCWFPCIVETNDNPSKLTSIMDAVQPVGTNNRWLKCLI
jgi:hypothetical protein